MGSWNRFLRPVLCVLLLAIGCSSPSAGPTAGRSTGGRGASQAPESPEGPARREGASRDTSVQAQEERAGEEGELAAGGRSPHLPGLPTRLERGPEPATRSRLMVASPTDGRIVGWDLDRVRDNLATSGTKPEWRAPDYVSPEVGAFNDTVPWGDQLLASATNLLAVVSFDRVTLEPRGYVPFDRPRFRGEQMETVIPLDLAMLDDTAYLSMSANDRAGVARLELTTGRATTRVFDEQAFSPGICAAGDRVYLSTSTGLLELSASDLSVMRRVDLPWAGVLACLGGYVVVGVQSEPELHWVDRLTMQTIGTTRWTGEGAAFALALDDGVALADEKAGLVVWCRFPGRCESSGASPRAVEVVSLDRSIGLIARGAFGLGGDENVLEVYDAAHRKVGSWKLPREARGAAVA